MTAGNNAGKGRKVGLMAALCGATAFFSNLTGVAAMAQDGSSANSVDFALKLFKHESTDVSKNVVVSPYSAYEALSMTANGAGGSTASQMFSVLGVQKGGLGALNGRNKEALQVLNEAGGVQMEIANAIYADDRTKFKSTFIDLCRNFYGAEVRNENFANPATVGKINAWCDAKTHGKITKILDSLTAAEKMVLLNSVYFKGNWDKPFDPANTKPQAFKLLSGSSKDVSMMHKTMDVEYLAEKDFQAVALPYAGQKQLMYIFLPAPGADLAAFQARLTPATWSKWTSGFHNEKDVHLSMPKYTINFSTELSKSLKAMGMAEAFDARADFSNMFADSPAAISRVLQKTYIAVDEKGTEAAAVTAVVMRAMAMYNPKPPLAFTVDRPFIIALVDQRTKEILFLGSIVDPTEK